MPEEQENIEELNKLIGKAQEICELMDGLVDRLKAIEDRIGDIDNRLKKIERDKEEEGRSTRTKFIGMLKDEFPSLFIKYNKNYRRIDINKIPFVSPPFAYVVIHTETTYSEQDLLNLMVLVKEDIEEKEAKEGG